MVDWMMNLLVRMRILKARKASGQPPRPAGGRKKTVDEPAPEDAPVAPVAAPRPPRAAVTREEAEAMTTPTTTEWDSAAAKIRSLAERREKEASDARGRAEFREKLNASLMPMIEKARADWAKQKEAMAKAAAQAEAERKADRALLHEIAEWVREQKKAAV